MAKETYVLVQARYLTVLKASQTAVRDEGLPRQHCGTVPPSKIPADGRVVCDLRVGLYTECRAAGRGLSLPGQRAMASREDAKVGTVVLVDREARAAEPASTVMKQPSSGISGLEFDWGIDCIEGDIRDTDALEAFSPLGCVPGG